MSQNYFRPRNLKVRKDSKTMVTLTWLPPDPDDLPPVATTPYKVVTVAHMVFMSKKPAGAPPDYELVATVGMPTLTWTLDGLEPGAWYGVRVIPLIKVSPVSDATAWGRAAEEWFTTRGKVLTGPAVPSDVHRG